MVGSHHTQGSLQRAKLGAAGGGKLPNPETRVPFNKGTKRIRPTVPTTSTMQMSTKSEPQDAAGWESTNKTLDGAVIP